MLFNLEPMILAFMKIGKDYVLVKLKAPTIDKRGNIHMHTSINKDQHYQNKAEVVSVPVRMSKNKRLNVRKEEPLEPNGIQGEPDYGGWFGYDEHGQSLMTDDDQFKIMAANSVLYSNEYPKWHNYADIAREVEIGDMIYFSWTALSKESNFVRKEDGYQIWKIDYPNIYCSFRSNLKWYHNFLRNFGFYEERPNTLTIMIGSWTFIDPEWQDILMKTYYPIELTAGVKKLRPKKEWIQTKVEPTSEEMKGCVSHVGSPLKGKECYIKPGDHVYFMKGSKIRIEVEGKKYYVMRQHRIIALREIA